MQHEIQSLYEITGDIKDFNTLLVPRSIFDKASKDAHRYNVLRNPKYQMHEDDPSVADSYFTVYFDEELDNQVDALDARYLSIKTTN